MNISVYDKDFNFVDVIDIFKSFLWVDRYNQNGDFKLTNLVDLKWLQLLVQNTYIGIDDSEHDMIVEDLEIITDPEQGNELSLTGRSLESILMRRIIWGQKLFDGNFQDGIQELLNENLISPTDTDRQITNFIFIPSTDPVITSLTLKNQWFCTNLYTAIQKACEAKGVGFKVIRNHETNNFEFSLYVGVDRSQDQLTNPQVTFSPNFDNLLETNYFKSNKNLRTVGFVAGEGEGTARKTKIVNATGGGLTGLDRREMFVDASSISQTTDSGTLPEADYLDQLEQFGFEVLEDNILFESFDGEIETTTQYTYGVDFFMGDIVQIENEYGMETKSRVVEMIRSYDQAGNYMYPSFKKIED